MLRTPSIKSDCILFVQTELEFSNFDCNITIHYMSTREGHKADRFQNCRTLESRRNSRLNRFWERPPLHLGLELHVLDLQGEALPVHAAVLLSWLIMIITQLGHCQQHCVIVTKQNRSLTCRASNEPSRRFSNYCMEQVWKSKLYQLFCIFIRQYFGPESLDTTMIAYNFTSHNNIWTIPIRKHTYK